MEKRLERALKRAALEYKPGTMGDGTTVYIVDTNYMGPYPTRESAAKSAAAAKIASARGLKWENRGYYTAVYIYLPKEDKTA